jgi:hypothetical protein
MVREVRVPFDERSLVHADGLNSALRYFAVQEADSHDLEDILNDSMQSHYKAQPNGETNYGGKTPKIGRVFLCRFNNRNTGKANIEYSPSKEVEDITGGYVGATIGVINLREKTWLGNWEEGKFDEKYHQIPTVLMENTERVMKALGLTRRERE